VPLALEVDAQADGDRRIVLDDEHALARLVGGPALRVHHSGTRLLAAFSTGAEAGAAGRTMVNVEPLPGALSTTTRARCARATWFTMARPRPEPWRLRERRSSTR